MASKNNWAIIHNPNKFWLKHELWLSREVPYWSETDNKISTKRVTKCFKAFTTEGKAMSELGYQVEVEDFIGECV